MIKRSFSLEAVQTKGSQVTSQDMYGAFGRFVDVEIGFRMLAYYGLGKVGKALLSTPCQQPDRIAARIIEARRRTQGEW
jgi:hypothetical protein